jgi:hypothetical protein
VNDFEGRAASTSSERPREISALIQPRSGVSAFLLGLRCELWPDRLQSSRAVNVCGSLFWHIGAWRWPAETGQFENAKGDKTVSNLKHWLIGAALLAFAALVVLGFFQ